MNLEDESRKRLGDYYSTLDAEHKLMLKDAIGKLREKGFSWLFLATAIDQKDASNWIKWGYGLMFTPSYQAQVQKKVTRIKSGVDESVPLFDAVQEQPNELISKPIESQEQEHSPQPKEPVEQATCPSVDVKPTIEQRYQEMKSDLQNRLASNAIDSSAFEQEYTQELTQICFPLLDDDARDYESKATYDDERAACSESMFNGNFRHWNQWKSKHSKEAAKLIEAEHRKRIESGLNYHGRCKGERFYESYKLWDLP